MSTPISTHITIQLMVHLKLRCTPKTVRVALDSTTTAVAFIFSMHNISRPPSRSNQTRALKARIYIKLPVTSPELQHVIIDFTKYQLFRLLLIYYIIINYTHELPLKLQNTRIILHSA